MDHAFYARDAGRVARDLLGCELVHAGVRGRIVETEAYRGRSDPASHAANGPTDRNRVMFGPPGRSYVYLCYGIHAMFNVVATRDGIPGGVLVRAVEPLEGLDAMRDRRGVDETTQLCSGPGKLCTALGITLQHGDRDLRTGDLRIEHGPAPTEVERTGRIGVAAGEDLPLRFLAPDSPHVSC